MDNYSKLPSQIRVKIKKAKEGTFFAELPQYDVFTEANDSFELFANINDLIYALFDIPKKLQGKILYFPPPKAKPIQKIPSSLLFYSALKEDHPSRLYDSC